jgi:hypothetical protein
MQGGQLFGLPASPAQVETSYLYGGLLFAAVSGVLVALDLAGVF